MAKLEYQSPRARTAGAGSASSSDVSIGEFIVPLILLVAGLLMYGIIGFRAADTRSAFLVMGFVLIAAILQAILGVIAAFITASLLSTGFGELRTAWIKLAGIIVFTSALGAIIPFGGLLAIGVYLILLMWQFQLEFFEAFVFSIVLGVIRFAAVMLIVSFLGR